jgi:hypothetical protein
LTASPLCVNVVAKQLKDAQMDYEDTDRLNAEILRWLETADANPRIRDLILKGMWVEKKERKGANKLSEKDMLNAKRFKSIQRNNTSGVRGVYFNKNHKKWEARINDGKKRVRLGSFATIDEARDARIRAERELWGKNAG